MNSHSNPIDLLWSYSIKCHLRSIHPWSNGIHADRDVLQCELCRQEFREMRGSALGAIVAELDEVTMRAGVEGSVITRTYMVLSHLDNATYTRCIDDGGSIPTGFLFLRPLRQ